MSNETLSQDQIEQLLRDAGHIEDVSPEASGDELNIDDYLTKDEQDILGEMGNICMGTSATTMFTLLSRQVNITTPQLHILTMEQLGREYPLPLVIVEVQYTEGVDGNNLLILKREDVALITDLLLGGDGSIDPTNVQMDELHLSAIQEVMNQMVGSSATSLSEMINKRVDISTPIAREITITDIPISEAFSDNKKEIVKISFIMEIEGVLTSEIMQVLPIDFAKNIAADILKNLTGGSEPFEAIEDKPKQEPAGAPAYQQQAYAPQAQQPVYSAPPAQAAPMQQAPMQQAPMMQQAPPMQQAYAPQPAYQPEPMRSNFIASGPGVNVNAAQFPNFDENAYSRQDSAVPSNINLIMDVPMKVTVQLGKTRRKVKDILDFNTGSVIVLDKMAGEAVDILVNGKIIGKGEVVVIEDNYGVRITEINVPPAETLI